MARRIVVLSPTSTTGGPELLHQLVDSLRRKGADAHICYFPFDEPAETPQRYRAYEIDIVDFHDDPATLFVVPEASTWLVRHIRAGSIAIWWMSVDNHFGPAWSTDLRTNYYKLKHLLLRRTPLFRLRKHVHLHQSEYARLFLARRGVTSQPLSDYLGRRHLDDAADLSLKQDIIAYNPRKGFETTRRLQRRFPRFAFVPIEDMTEQEVSDLLSTAKVYIDFGAHPGKDRLPREAAMAGCCVITGRRGSAGNPVDIPILKKYKIPEDAPDFFQRFEPLADFILANYQLASADFDAYRERIRHEPERFEAEVSNMLKTLVPNNPDQRA